MASTVGVTLTAEQPTSIEVFPWLKTLPVAPEYHPTLAEFQDPIGYIFKIEKEASQYGICKIVPPVPPLPKKTAIANLNRSLAARSASSDPTFTTRQQQIGFCPRKHRPVQKPVWQSGENYTLPQFEAKAKAFEKNYLKKTPKKVLSALEIETLYWKATVDKPFSVEYANDMPGSVFSPMIDNRSRETGDGINVGETAWNMSGVSRAKGSLLTFMKEEIPGVTSPMMYIAMMFSWFAWHVEDHDLHSLNYLHTGAGKTWYGVPRDAAVAFEEVIRVHGYGGEINPIVTFSTLGEKTTVMSPEVLVNAGVPCCRLVQNAGEFVVTFPRAYHSGFSHGFNCGEAANVATPGWLRVAKDAAIRRASINCPPMLSHFQLLYDLAVSLYSRVSVRVLPEPRSSRLKDKKKGEGEILVKELFVQDFIQNNEMLHALGKGSSVTLLPQYTLQNSVRANLPVRSQLKVKPNQFLAFCSSDDEMVVRKRLNDESILESKQEFKQLTGYYPLQEKFSFCERNRLPLSNGNDDVLCSLAPQTHCMDDKNKEAPQSDRLSDRGLFSCVACGILCFACVAIVQPRDSAAEYLMSAKCSTASDWDVNSGATTDGFTGVSRLANDSQLSSSAGWMLRTNQECLYDVPVQSSGQMETSQQSRGVVSDREMQKDTSSLGLLALNYGDDSDSEEDPLKADIAVNLKETKSRVFSPEFRLDCNDTGLPDFNHYTGGSSSRDLSRTKLDVCKDELPFDIDAYEDCRHRRADFSDRTFDDAAECQKDPSVGLNSLAVRFRQRMRSFFREAEAITGDARVLTDSTNRQFGSRSDEDSLRLHVFCLEHAVEVEQQLRPIGGVNMLLLCHPDYPKLEAEAKLVAKELGVDHDWNKIELREANKEDEERIQLALDSEEAIHGNGDWAVKLGINLYYSANLSRSPLYSKQMPYNSIIYGAFGCSSPSITPEKPKEHGKGSGKQKKIVVAGKWCGKVWMSNQVHPLLAERDVEEEEQGRIIMAVVKSDAELGRQPESIHAPKTSAITRAGKKRKKRAERRPIVDATTSEVEKDPIEALDDSLVEVSHKQQNRNLRNKQIKKETPQSPNKYQGRNRLFASCVEDEMEGGISTRLRKRTAKPPKESKAKTVEAKLSIKKPGTNKKAKKAPSVKASASYNTTKIKNEEEEYSCDMEGCTMTFGSKQELTLHKRNICPVKGCYKKFFSHKYLVQHRRVHLDDRPLKCPWKGCKMTFKWAWARTEHIRVHTGARPYVCKEAGCGQTFRFVSDFSRHKRKTGHSMKKEQM